MNVKERLIFSMVAGLGLYWILRSGFSGGNNGNLALSGKEKSVLQYAGLIQTSALNINVDPALISAMIDQESGGDSKAVGGAGELGLMQILPSTAAETCGLSSLQLFDPAGNIACGTTYFRRQMNSFYSVPPALVAYNAGPGNVHQDFATQKFYTTVTRAVSYAKTVMEKAKRYRLIWSSGQYMDSSTYNTYFPRHIWDVTFSVYFMT